MNITIAMDTNTLTAIEAISVLLFMTVTLGLLVWRGTNGR